MNVALHPRITQAAEGLPRRRFTVAEVEAMVAAGIIDEDERVELIGGELVPMSPKGIQHEALKIRLVDRWNRHRPLTCVVAQETTFHLSDDTYVEPDVVIFPEGVALRALSPHNVLLALEIADSSRHYDMGRKAALYASFGVRELWVLDAAQRTTRVFRKPTAGGYGETRDLGASDLLTPEFAPPEFALRLDDLESL